MVETILASACLLGKKCRFDGRDSLDHQLIDFLKGFQVIGVCPEELVGLRGLRGPFEIKGDTKDVFCNKAKVTSIKGRDVTDKFIKAAYKILDIAEKKNVELAILKSKSPTCSPDFIYNGKFSHTLKRGLGVTAYILKENKIKIISNDQFKESQEGFMQSSSAGRRLFL